jgi:hypothetical protein
MKALNSGHVAWVVPNWQATANGATVHAAEFFDLSHEVWSACSAHIKDNTITSTMYAIVWDALQSAYTDAMAANYFSCVRSLRFIFEFAVQAALLEIKYAIIADSQSTKITNAFADSQFQRFKFSMLSELEHHGIVQSSERSKLETLYGDLSVKGTHANPTYLSRLKLNVVAFHQFDIDLFRECKEMCRGVVDLLLVVLFKKYPLLAYDPILQGWVSQLNLAMSHPRLHLVP